MGFAPSDEVRCPRMSQHRHMKMTSLHPDGESEPGREGSSLDVPAADEGYRRAVALLRKISTPDGFLAAPTEKANYRRVWSRDGVIIGLAALLSEDDELIESFERPLCTLARHQGPRGEIPSNVDTVGGRVSYGGTTGRVDADLWFIVGCVEYWSATGDESFLECYPCSSRTSWHRCSALPMMPGVHASTGSYRGWSMAPRSSFRHSIP